MKFNINIFVSVALGLATLMSVTSCDEKYEPVEETKQEQGHLSTKGLVIDVVNAETIIKSRAEGVDLSGYRVKILDAAGRVLENWAYSEMPELPALNVGSYTLRVQSHDTAPAAEWETPWFMGEKPIEITLGGVTEAGAVTCRLSNLKVSVIFSPELVAASAGDLQCEIRVNDNNKLTFAQGETRSGFFAIEPGASTMVAVFSGTVNGYKEEIIRPYRDVAAGQHRIITFSLKTTPVNPPNAVGSFDPTGGLNVDVTVVDVDLRADINPGDGVIGGGDRPGNEVWPDDPVQPDVPAATFSSPTLDLEGVNPIDRLPAAVTIDCPKGISHLWVTINSPSLHDALVDLGLGEPFDLAYPGELEGVLKESLGLPTGDEVIGKNTLVFDISQFVPMLAGFPGDHEFVLEVTDADGNKSTLNLKFKS